MKYGKNIAKIKQRCRSIVYISIILFFTCTYIHINLYRDGDGDVETKQNEENVFASRKILEHPVVFDSSDLWDRFLEKRQEGKIITTPKSLLANQSTTSATTSSATLADQSAIAKSTTTPNSTTNTTRKHHHKCEAPSISEFPKDLLTQKQRKHGGFLVHVLVSIYMCIGLAIVCDYYFVPSLEVICYKLDMQSDVAGATLMAVGSSAPELFASIIGVFITNGDIGIGTILGSAIFNVLFVLGMSGLLAKTDLQLAWWPLLRDGFCYSISLVALALVIVDGKVTWVESTVLLVLYLLYVIFMWKNQFIEETFYIYLGFMDTYESRFGKIAQENEEDEEEHLLSKKEKRNYEKCMEIANESEEKQATSNEEVYSTSLEEIKVIPLSPG